MLAKTLKDAVAEAIKYTGAGDQMPVIHHVLLVSDITDGLKIAATDFEARIEINIPESLGDWSACVRAKQLLEFLASAGSDKLSAKYDAKRESLELSAGTANANFKCIAASEFPPAPKNEWTANIKFDKKHSSDWVRKVGFCASEDKARPVLQGYHIRLVNLTNLTIEAADGYRMSRLKDQVEPVAGTTTKIDGSWTILKKPFENALRLGVDQFSAGNTVCLLQSDHVKVWIQLVEGSYPDLDQIVPKPTNELIIGAGAVATAVKRCQIISEMTCFETKEDGFFVHTSETEIGQHSELLPAEKAFGTMKFCLASLFASEAAAAGDGKFRIANDRPNAPVLITEVDNPNWTHVIMPRMVGE